MFDCLETPPFQPAASQPSNQLSTRQALARLARHHRDRNWIRFSSRQHNQPDLGRVRELARHLSATVEPVGDDSLVVFGLTLTETLALAERFGTTLAVEAHIAAGPRTAQRPD